MDSFARDVYLGEILQQAAAVELAITDMESNFYGDNATMDRFWYSVDAFLVALARLTRIVWPIESQSRKPAALDRAERGEYLRKLLAVETNEWKALLETRHSMEHFDERLDRWRLATELQTFADRNIMTSTDLADRDQRDVARNFDPAARTISVFGDAVNVDDAREASQKLVANVWAVVSPHSHLRNVFPPPA